MALTGQRIAMVDVVFQVFPAFPYLPYGWMEPEFASEEFLLTFFRASFFPFCPRCWPPLFLPFSRHLFALSPPRKVLCSVEKRVHSRAWRGAALGCTSPKSWERKFLPEICVKNTVVFWERPILFPEFPRTSGDFPGSRAGTFSHCGFEEQSRDSPEVSQSSLALWVVVVDIFQFPVLPPLVLRRFGGAVVVADGPAQGYGELMSYQVPTSKFHMLDFVVLVEQFDLSLLLSWP